MSSYVTGYELRTVRTGHMGGSGTTTLRIPHGIPAGRTVDDLPVRALCGTMVQQLSDKPWPPAQTLDSQNQPCMFCANTEVVEG